MTPAGAEIGESASYAAAGPGLGPVIAGDTIAAEPIQAGDVGGTERAMREHLTYLRDLVERSARAADPAADAAHRQPGQSTVEGRGITSR